MSLGKVAESLVRLHSMRGNKLVQAARGSFAIDKAPRPPAIVLPVYDWLEVAAAQGPLTKISLSKLKHGAVVALEGRTTDARKPWRRIFVRVDTSAMEVQLFNRWSGLLDESEDGVPNGKLAMNKFLHEFNEAGGKRYRPPQLVDEQRDEGGAEDDVELNLLVGLMEVCSYDR